MAFYIQPGQILVKRFFQMIFFAVLGENTVQCPKTYFLCLLCIYTFLIASFYLFVQLTDLGSKNPLQLAHFGYQDAKIFGTKFWGGSLDFNVYSPLRGPISSSCVGLWPSAKDFFCPLGKKNFIRRSLPILGHFWCTFSRNLSNF